MGYSIKQLTVKIIVLLFIPLFTLILIVINAPKVMANNNSNERTNQSEWRNYQSSQAKSPNLNNGQSSLREINLTREEAQMFKLINQERAKAGLPQFEINATLTKLARDKSLDMVGHNYFGHYSERFGTIHDQLKAAKVSYGNAAENLAGGPNLTKTHCRILASPAHRSNLLNPKFKKIGIGIVKGSPYGKMITQIFID
ncbi:MAG: hypothetical protein GXY86_10935 [Firmicutes bacterium]|nr:hypothetical protein [Bacillota bacterium]